MLTNCCAYSCTQYGLHKQYMHLTYDDELLCLQLYTVRSAYRVHASNPCWRLAVTTAANSTFSTHTVYASNPCWWLTVPTAAHSTFSTHSTCFWPMLLTCCAYSCTQYGLHTQYMLLTHADYLLCLQLHTVRSALTVHASNPCWWLSLPTDADSTVCINSTCFWPMLLPCCAYSCTQYGLHTQYILLTHVDDFLCLQLHTVRSAVPTAAHSTVSIHSTCCSPMLLTCCTYSCTHYGLHTQYMLLTHAADLLCL